MSGTTGEDAMANFNKALEEISAKKAGSKPVVSGEDDEDVQFIRSIKLKPAARLTPFTSKKKQRAQGQL